MKVLFVVRGGVVVGGERLATGQFIQEGTALYKKVLETKLGGVCEKYEGPRTRIVHCEINDLDGAFDALPDAQRIELFRGRVKREVISEEAKKALLEAAAAKADKQPVQEKVEPQQEAVEPVDAPTEVAEDTTAVEAQAEGKQKKGRAKKED